MQMGGHCLTSRSLWGPVLCVQAPAPQLLFPALKRHMCTKGTGGKKVVCFLHKPILTHF